MAQDVSFKISAIDDFTRTMDKLEKGFKGVEKAGEKIGQVGKDMTTKVTAPIIGMATGIGIVGAKFDESMSKVQAISGATGNELDKLRDIAKEMGSVTQFSASQSADALQYMALAGWDTQQMIDGLPGVLDLAASGALDLARASDIMTDSMSMFGMGADEAGRAADVFAKAQATSNTNVEQLGEAIKYAGATANAAGMSIEQTSAILGVFANNGVKGSSAGTTLDAMFRDLKSSVENGAIAIGEASVSVYDANGAMRSMSDIMADVEKATEGMDGATKDAALSNIFQSQALRGVNILMGAGTDAVNDLESALYNSNGAADEMANVMNDNVMGAFREMKSALEGAAISMYELLQPAISAVIEKITGLVRWFTGLGDRTKMIIMIIAGVVAAIGPLLLIIGSTIAVVGKLITIFKAVGTAMSAVSLGPIVLIVGAIAALIAIFVIAYKKLDWFREMVNTAWSLIKDYFLSALTYIKEIVMDLIGKTTDFIAEKLSWITDFWDENGKQIMSIVKNLFEIVSDVFSVHLSAIVTLVKMSFTAIKAVITVLLNAVKSFIDLTLNTVLNTIQFWLKILTGDWEGAWQTLKDLVFGNLNIIVDFIKGLGSTFYNAGKGLIEQMTNGIKNTVSKAVDAVKNVASKVRDFLPFSPAKDGPLSDLDKLDFAGPITMSISKGLPTIQSQMSHALEVPTMNVKPMSADKYVSKDRKNEPQNVTNDKRVYITVEGNIDRDLYDDIMKRQKDDYDTRLTVAGVRV